MEKLWGQDWGFLKWNENETQKREERSEVGEKNYEVIIGMQSKIHNIYSFYYNK